MKVHYITALLGWFDVTVQPAKPVDVPQPICQLEGPVDHMISGVVIVLGLIVEDCHGREGGRRGGRKGGEGGQNQIHILPKYLNHALAVKFYIIIPYQRAS